jgi:hypothetical protein
MEDRHRFSASTQPGGVAPSCQKVMVNSRGNWAKAVVPLGVLGTTWPRNSGALVGPTLMLSKGVLKATPRGFSSSDPVIITAWKESPTEAVATRSVLPCATPFRVILPRSSWAGLEGGRTRGYGLAGLKRSRVTA